jgi:uncharacterized membrane protein
MASQQASAIVNLPLDEVQARLRDVETWPRFLIGLESITRLAHERYRLGVREGKRQYDVDVCLFARPREHRFAWRALARPRWDGELRLSAEGERRTRVRLSLQVEPRGRAAVWSEMVSGTDSHALLDMYRLQDVLGASVTHADGSELQPQVPTQAASDRSPSPSTG